MKLHEREAELRAEGTRSEDILWQALRNRWLSGRKFRRQVPIGAFILDFLCAEEKLAIEVDGSIHELQGEAGRLRQETLETLVIRFLRFSVEEVLNDLSGVLKRIEATFST